MGDAVEIQANTFKQNTHQAAIWAVFCCPIGGGGIDTSNNRLENIP